MRVKVRGYPSLRRKLRQLPPEQRRAVAIEVKAALLAVEASAKGRTPVRTGRLRGSLSHEVDAERIGGRVGTNVHYAPYVELGTRRMRAQPYLLPALLEVRPSFVNALRKRLDEAHRKTSR